MDIEGMGESVVEQLVRLRLVKNLADVYSLSGKELSSLELFKEKKVNNLLAAIKKSKNAGLSRLVYALGIRHVGEKASEVLADRFKNMDALSQVSKGELESIYEIGPVIAQSVTDFFSQRQTKELIRDLKKYSVDMTAVKTSVKENIFTGKTVVFTGELSGMSRPAAEQLIRQSGGRPSSSVSKETDFVIVGENPGSKYDKARQLGIAVINESQFKHMLEER
jgi:DNA ligase (NAD+)